MANPFEQNINSIKDVFGSWNPMTYLKGMDQLDQANAYNQNDLKGKQQETGLAELMNPIKVRQAGLNADTTEAQLPGVRANSSLQSDKANLSTMTFGNQLDEMVKGHEFKDRERELKEIQGAGQAYGQAGAYLGSIPVPARTAAAKQMLGGYWRPEFEQMDPNDLADTLSTAGKWMTEAQQKFMMQQAGLEAKGNNALALQDKKSQAAESLAKFKVEAKRISDATKAQPLPRREQVLGQLLQQIAQETDPERKEVLQNTYNELAAQVYQEKLNIASASATGKPDIGAMTGLPTKPAPATPQLGAGNNPATADPNLAKLPQGTKALGNGIYQLPDGTKIKANK